MKQIDDAPWVRNPEKYFDEYYPFGQIEDNDEEGDEQDVRLEQEISKIRSEM